MTPRMDADVAVVGVGEDSPGVPFAVALGGRPATSERRNLLRTGSVDRAEVIRYAGGAASRTDGYSLVRWTERCPDKLLPAYAAVMNAINDAPHGEVAWHPVAYRDEKVRRYEARVAETGRTLYVMAVRDDATGTLAGVTEVLVYPGFPRAEQGATTVATAYRGHGFGLWLKASMQAWLAGVEPHVTEFETYNNDTNDHMNAVNVRLGYRQEDLWQIYQVDLST